jgi:hypothetical protein
MQTYFCFQEEQWRIFEKDCPLPGVPKFFSQKGNFKMRMRKREPFQAPVDAI